MPEKCPYGKKSCCCCLHNYKGICKLTGKPVTAMESRDLPVPFTIKDFAYFMGLQSTRAREVLRDLLDRGLVKRVGRGLYSIEVDFMDRREKLYKLSGKPLMVWAETLHMRPEKVLEFLCELKKQGIVKDIEFV